MTPEGGDRVVWNPGQPQPTPTAPQMHPHQKDCLRAKPQFAKETGNMVPASSNTNFLKAVIHPSARPLPGAGDFSPQSNGNGLSGTLPIYTAEISGVEAQSIDY